MSSMVNGRPDMDGGAGMDARRAGEVLVRCLVCDHQWTADLGLPANPAQVGQTLRTLRCPRCGALSTKIEMELPE